jgi:hypothetical protein
MNCILKGHQVAIVFILCLEFLIKLYIFNHSSTLHSDESITKLYSFVNLVNIFKSSFVEFLLTQSLKLLCY